MLRELQCNTDNKKCSEIRKTIQVQNKKFNKKIKKINKRTKQILELKKYSDWAELSRQL